MLLLFCAGSVVGNKRKHLDGKLIEYIDSLFGTRRIYIGIESAILLLFGYLSGLSLERLNRGPQISAMKASNGREMYRKAALDIHDICGHPST